MSVELHVRQRETRGSMSSVIGVASGSIPPAPGSIPHSNHHLSVSSVILKRYVCIQTT